MVGFKTVGLEACFGNLRVCSCGRMRRPSLGRGTSHSGGGDVLPSSGCAGSKQSKGPGVKSREDHL